MSLQIKSVPSAAIADLITRAKGLDDIHDDLATADSKISHTEDIASGNSGGDGAWHDALDIDTRGMKSMTLVMKNTDGANSLNWRLRARYASYTACDDEEIIEAPGDETLAPSIKSVGTLIRGYSRVKVQVQDTTPGSAAAYTLYYLVNR